MSNGSKGITFRETMRGGFSLDEVDPEKGERRGKAMGTTLVMHATVNVPDLKRFTADPNVMGSLTGSIDFTPWGQNIPSQRGVFKLFAPTPSPKLTIMVYEMAFQYGGQNYYLAGHKNVQDEPGFDLWRDTTTLLVQLHEGDNRSAPVVGAGILTLGARDLLKLALSMRATRARWPWGKLSVYLSFIRFFIGNLFRTYGRK